MSITGGKERFVAVGGKVVKANGKAVTIDILAATSDAFGGVKADPASETDTQPVRIGTDGKLVTASGGGAEGAVLYTTQELTDAQKATARSNIGVATPDWGQNNEAAPGYIKNRPFYSEITEESASGFDGWLSAVGSLNTIPKVSVNGTIYENVPENYIAEYAGYYIVGDYKIEINLMTNTMTTTMADGSAVTGDPPSIIFIWQAENIVKLDEKYLPIDVPTVATTAPPAVASTDVEGHSQNYARADHSHRYYSPVPVLENFSWGTIFCEANTQSMTFAEAKEIYADRRPYLVYNDESFIAAELTDSSVTIVYMGKGNDGQWTVKQDTFDITWKSTT